jgi:O-antigen/teichoic acid export membrane protein
MEIKELKRRSIKGVMSYGTRTLFLYGFTIVATGLLSAYLSPADFGVYFVVSAVIGIFSFMSDIGLAATLVQKKQEPTLEELRTTFTVQQALAISIFIISILLTPFWKQFANLDENGILLLYALAFSFIMASLKTIPSILLERKMEFGKIVIPQILETITFYSIAVILARQGRGVESYTYAVFARSIIGVIGIYLIQPWQIGLAFTKDTFKKLLSFGAKFQLNDLLARIKDDLFITVLARFLPAQEMGYIGWAKRWSMFPYQLSVNSVVAITFPTFSRLQDDPRRLAQAVEKSVFFISFLIFPVLVGMVFLAPAVINLIPAYQKWQPALASLVFFCINISWSAVSTPLTNTLNAIGKISITLKLMLFWTAATWVLTPICIYFFGFTGVAIASAIIASTSAVSIVIIKRILKIRLWDQVWRQLLASMVMTAGLYFGMAWWSQSFYWLFAGVMFGGLLYLVPFSLVGFSKLQTEVKSLWAK